MNRLGYTLSVLACALVLVMACGKVQMADHVQLPGPVTNQDPIVFVHGFAGWGPEEMLGYSYWGGTQDVIKDLNAHNYPAIAASVGPVSSNWDRACELYAQLTGTRVDYGAVHAKRFGLWWLIYLRARFSLSLQAC